jgi:hypothetical protein
MTVVVIGMVGIILVLTMIDETVTSADKNIQTAQVVAKSE